MKEQHGCPAHANRLTCNMTLAVLVQGCNCYPISISLVMVQNITIENNTVNGEPVGNRAVAAEPEDVDIFASPQRAVWEWPNGPPRQSFPNTSVAEIAVNIAREELKAMRVVRSFHRSQSRLRKVACEDRGVLNCSINVPADS